MPVEHMKAAVLEWKNPVIRVNTDFD